MINSQEQPFGTFLSPSLAGGDIDSPRSETFTRVGGASAGCFPNARVPPSSFPPALGPLPYLRPSRQSAKFCFLSIMQKINQPGREAELSTTACN